MKGEYFMRKSARILGQEYGLTAQEMNCVLKDAGYLEGSSGNYDVTEKGLPFAEEKDFHRGTGGYAQYNRYWTTRSWDESIEDELHIDDEIKKKARDEVASLRQQQRDEMMAAREEADAQFLASQNAENYDTENPNESTDDADTLTKVIIVGGLIAIGYGIYKAAPHVVNWWNEKVSKKSKDIAVETKQKEKTKK